MLVRLDISEPMLIQNSAVTSAKALPFKNTSVVANSSSFPDHQTNWTHPLPLAAPAASSGPTRTSPNPYSGSFLSASEIPAMFSKWKPLKRNPSNASSIGSGHTSGTSSFFNAYSSSQTSMSTSPGKSTAKLKKKHGPYPPTFTRNRHHTVPSSSSVVSFASSFEWKPAEPPSLINPTPPRSRLRLREREPEEKNYTVRKRGEPHHPFPLKDAPYVLSYSSVILDSEYYTERLLRELVRELVSDYRPTFLNLMEAPSDVLDLGCGAGFWVMYAAEKWKSAGTRVTGLDLIDVYTHCNGDVFGDLDSPDLPENVSWVRGNFVKDGLPFADETFDLVRMADLNLCIPQNRWDFVLAEVRRVLKLGGRLELITDDPPPRISEPPLPSPSRERSPSRRNGRLFDPHEADVIQHSWEQAQHIHIDEGNSLQASSSSVHAQPQHSRVDSQAWCLDAAAANAADLERLFDEMLLDKCNIKVDPNGSHNGVLTNVFGKGNMQQMYEFRLSIPTRELLVEGANVYGKPPAVRPRKGDDKIDKEPVSVVQMSPKNNLGDSKNSRFEPPGLVVTRSPPSTPHESLIHFTSDVLDMHVCKHMHVLLGSRSALLDYMLERTCDEFLAEKCRDSLWDYERFRRCRYNLPQEYSGVDWQAPKTSTFLKLLEGIKGISSPHLPTGRPRAVSTSGDRPLRSGDRPLRSGEGNAVLKEVRIIRVYTAVKPDCGSFLSLTS